MLLRFAAENVMSFKNAVEFNTFPSSKSHSHEWHKMDCGYVTALRMSAIYGANGAGKSNLLKCIALLKSLVGAEKMGEADIAEDLYFKLDENGKNTPSELAVEFFTEGKIFYYHLRFNRQEVFEEELLLSQKSKDIRIFSRKDNDINVSGDYLRPGGKDDFIEVFMNAMNRIVRPDMLALSFFGKYYPEELPAVKEAYDWIRRLQVVLPTMRIGYLPHVLDGDSEFAELVNSIMPELKTGITKLGVRKEILNEDEVRGNTTMTKAINAAKEHPGTPQMLMETHNNEISNIVVEDGVPYIKTLIAVHTNYNGDDVEMKMDMESDGTRRLIEYMPLLYAILKRDNVFVVDEIERSIHPIMIKTLMSKISENRDAKGQIIFTTHESCLLDQSIFRPDEIWFAQKDVDQSTQLYPLSDYNIHKTANIENGYLNGRYGGIPFLSNLSDLNGDMITRRKDYSKSEPTKDASKIYIVCEGKGSEPDYFGFFEGLSSNLELIVIPPEEGTDPLKLMELAERILLGDTRKHTIDYLQQDKIWFAIDTDSWEKEGKIAPLRNFCRAMNARITEKYSEAKPYEAWNVAQSNPCFEVWLYYHHYADRPDREDVEKQPSVKAYVNKQIAGGFDYQRDPARLQDAIDNSEKNYTQQDNGNPDWFATEQFLLGKEIMGFVKTEVRKLRNKLG